MKKLVPACLVVVACLFGAAARAQIVIDHLPYAITASGDYVLNRNLSTSQTTGDLITVGANNVTIDLQGHFISGPANNTSQTTFGIHAIEKSNVTVRNGTVAHCNLGIYFYGLPGNTSSNAVGGVVENMRVTYCNDTGISVNYYLASRVTNCQVSAIGYNGASSAYGINGYGYGTLIQGNTVASVTATYSYGIYAYGGYARQNVVTQAKYGVVGGKYQDNLTMSCTTPVSGGTDAGGNN